MAIFIKMEQRKNSKNSSYGKYYTKTVPMGEVTSEDIANDITRVDCKFLPEGHRNPFDGTITRTLTEGVKAKWAPSYERE